MNDVRDELSKLRKPVPPHDLEGRVLFRIGREARRMMVVKMVVTAAALGVSAVALAFAAVIFGRDVSQSGFIGISSLLFSDFSSALANYRDFGLSIVESFPAFSAAFVLAGLTGVIVSVGFLIDETRYLQSFGRFGSHERGL